MDCEGEGRNHHVRNRLELLEWIVEPMALEDRFGDMGARAAQEDGVAIRAGASDGGSTERTASSPWLSTTTVPSTDFIFSAQGRPTASYPPPGGKGITSRIGRSGYLD